MPVVQVENTCYGLVKVGEKKELQHFEERKRDGLSWQALEEARARALELKQRRTRNEALLQPSDVTRVAWPARPLYTHTYTRTAQA